MSLYYEAASILTSTPTSGAGAGGGGGSLKSRIFSRKDLKAQPAQIYALAIETCKWSPVLKEVVERADILRLERKITPVLSLLLVHDLLLKKGGVALPATHGLRTAVERHRGRLQAELTRVRVRRKASSLEALRELLEQESAGDDGAYPRWVRVNTLKSSVAAQLAGTFAGHERVASVGEVRRGRKRVCVDAHVPHLLAVSRDAELAKSEAYRRGEIIFQDKASCFPACLLDWQAGEGEVVDSCAAPGNKTTHVAAIMGERSQGQGRTRVFAWEKDGGRAETLKRMVGVAGADEVIEIHPGQDFLRTDPTAGPFKRVGALLLDPSCSGSGIVGRDEMPELCLPALKTQPEATGPVKKGNKPTDVRKRKREDQQDLMDVMVDDDGVVTAVTTDEELQARLAALSTFQLELLLHAMKFPAARKITYSTCSVHAAENERVVLQALAAPEAQERGWRLLQRHEQVAGLRAWPVRGDVEAAEGNKVVAESCIRANKGDEHGTMGFFLTGFVRGDASAIPVEIAPEEENAPPVIEEVEVEADAEEEWGGIEEEAVNAPVEAEPKKQQKVAPPAANKHAFGAGNIRTGLVPKNKKRRKGKTA